MSFYQVKTIKFIQCKIIMHSLNIHPLFLTRLKHIEQKATHHTKRINYWHLNFFLPFINIILTLKVFSFPDSAFLIIVFFNKIGV
jgi:hypothetical protein